MKHPVRNAAIGLALIAGTGFAGAVGAHGMSGMMGGGMMSGSGAGSGGMMADCPMMGGQQSAGMQGGGMGMMQGGGMGMMQGGGMGMMRGMDLDDDQRMQLREHRSEHRRARFARMADMMDLRDEMHALMAADRPDPDAVQEVHRRMAEVHGEMLADRIRSRNRMHELLTEEQRKMLRQQRMQPGAGTDGPAAADDHGH